MPKKITGIWIEAEGVSKALAILRGDITGEDQAAGLEAKRERLLRSAIVISVESPQDIEFAALEDKVRRAQEEECKAQVEVLDLKKRLSTWFNEVANLSGDMESDRKALGLSSDPDDYSQPEDEGDPG